MSPSRFIHFISVFLLLSGLATSATAVSVKDAAFTPEEKAFCQTFDFPHYRKKCEVAMRSGSFLPEVFQFCGKEIFESERFDCVTAKPGLKVDWQAVLFCREFLFRADRDRCLNKVIGKPALAGSLEACRSRRLSQSGRLECLERLL